MRVQSNNPLISSNLGDSLKKINSMQKKDSATGVTFSENNSESTENLQGGSRLPQIDTRISGVQERISLNQTAQNVLPQIEEAITSDPEAARSLMENTEFNSENVFRQLGIDPETIQLPEDVVALEKTVSENMDEELNDLSRLSIARENVLASSVSIEDFNNAKQVIENFGITSDILNSFNSNINPEMAGSLLKDQL